ncbi:MAG TPA: CarD family transcriptional regulator, partial [Terriglobia bacterium]|nr:CarD family transcriptional regulator [Terriglobia bacterium]
MAETLERRVAAIFGRIANAVDFRRVAAETLRGESTVVVSGLAGTARALFVAGLWQTMRRPLVVVTAHDAEAATLAADIAYFHAQLNACSPDRVAVFPSWETDPYSGVAPHAEVQQARAATLWRLRRRMADVVVAPMRAILSRLPAPSRFDAACLRLAAGEEISQELLVEHLASAGYLREEPVGAEGEFSVRGGIVDLFSPLMPRPARIEFFGDSVDSIREFDLDDQRSRGPLQRIDILPMRDVPISGELLRVWSAAAVERWGAAFEKDLAEKRDLAIHGEIFPGMQFLMPLVAPLEATLLDYAGETALVLDEPEAIGEVAEEFLSGLERRYAETAGAGGVALPPAELFVTPGELEAGGVKRLTLERIGLDELGEGDAVGRPVASFRVNAQSVAKFHGRVSDMAEAVRKATEQGTDVALIGATVGMAERLRDILHEYGVPFRLEFGEQPVRDPGDSRAPIIGVGRISEGLRIPDAGLEIYAESDIFDESERLQSRHPRRSKVSAFISNLQDLKVGDYVVHVDHGIGTYNGITLVHDRECMVLLYQGADRLY